MLILLLRIFFGLSASHIEYETLLAMVHHEDQKHVKNHVIICFNKKTANSTEFRVIRGNHERWLRLSIYYVHEKSNDWIIGHAEDITVYKKHIFNISKHNSTKNSILNILSHDLAGPIGTIGNLTELLKRETSALDHPKINEYLTTVGRISKKCNDLIRDFLNLEFLESANVKLLKRRVELVERINNVMEKYVDMQSELKLTLSCHTNQPTIYVEIDEDKFLQVINNLISNSIKFTPQGGSIAINLEESRDSVLIKVADTGIGIPQKHHAILFEKFSAARRNGLNGDLQQVWECPS